VFLKDLIKGSARLNRRALIKVRQKISSNGSGVTEAAEGDLDEAQ